MKSVFESFLFRIQEATGIGTQNELAHFLGVHRSAITQAKNKDSIPDKWILKLSRSFGLDPNWLETGKGHPFMPGRKFQQVPKVQALLSAGGGSFQVDPDVAHYYSFHKEWLRKKGEPQNMVMMDITGNSMEPELKDGDTVLIDRSLTEIINGAVYALGVDEAIMIKRVEKHPGKIALISDNTAYSPIYLQGDEFRSVRVIGKVIWACREYR